MKVLTKVAIVLRGGRHVAPNTVVTIPDSHARTADTKRQRRSDPEEISAHQRSDDTG